MCELRVEARSFRIEPPLHLRAIDNKVIVADSNATYMQPSSSGRRECRR
jgi:hypothetical protein